MKKFIIFMMTLLMMGGNAFGFAPEMNVFKVTNKTQKPIQFSVLPWKQDAGRCRPAVIIVNPQEDKQIITKQDCRVFSVSVRFLDRSMNAVRLRPKGKDMKRINKFEVTIGADGTLKVGSYGFKPLESR